MRNFRGTLTLTNSTVSGNSAGFNGGGVTNGGTAILTNSTVSGNSAGTEGGGVSNVDGSLTLSRSLIAGNTARYGSEVDNRFGGTVNANDFNLFGHDGLTNTQAFVGFTPSGTDINATSDGGGIPTALTGILETNLATNGGTTRTHALEADSPAIDAITTGCPPPVNDQRSKSRP